MKSDADTGDAHVQHIGSDQVDVRDDDALFGDPEERKRLEKKLLRKVDRRMSILIVIYILNYVSLSVNLAVCFGDNEGVLGIDEGDH